MSSSGGDFLAKKSGLVRNRSTLTGFADVLIIDDDMLDADRMIATLRVMFGYDVVVRCASNIRDALSAIQAKQPDLIILDDILKPSDDGETTLPLIRAAGFAGPIVVISGQVTRTRRPTLLLAGATDVLHKDDVDSVRLAEALQKIAAKS